MARDEDFWEFVVKTRGPRIHVPSRFGEDVIGGCWLWTGGRDKDGYGFWYDQRGRMVRAHRKAYELCFGEILNGLTVDHLCSVRMCVNPNHMELVTQSVNAKRRRRVRRDEKTWTKRNVGFQTPLSIDQLFEKISP